MNKRRISIPKEYEVKWEKKTQWINAGVLFEKDGKTFWIINQTPVNWDGKFNVFDIEEKKDDIPF